jgi:hypothetical protein
MATSMLKPHEYFEYSLAQRGAAQTLYLATNNAFYNLLLYTTKGNALAHVLTAQRGRIQGVPRPTQTER